MKRKAEPSIVPCTDSLSFHLHVHIFSLRLADEEQDAADAELNAHRKPYAAQVEAKDLTSGKDQERIKDHIQNAHHDMQQAGNLYVAGCLQETASQEIRSLDREK